MSQETWVTFRNVQRDEGYEDLAYERQLGADMVRIPGGTFRMGSDKHYAEEAPAHRVSVDEFWIDRTPVTNRQFKAFVEATGHVTFAEILPDPKDYPGALPHMNVAWFGRNDDNFTIAGSNLPRAPCEHCAAGEVAGGWLTSAKSASDALGKTSSQKPIKLDPKWPIKETDFETAIQGPVKAIGICARSSIKPVTRV
jgi:hypothetical protein